MTSTAAYRDRTTGRYPITVSEIRSRVNVLFGAEPTPEVLNVADVDPVQATTPPPYNEAMQTLSEGDPVRTNGVWRQTWVVTDITVPERTYTWLEFMDLFTEAEQVELAGAAMTDPTMKLWYDRALGAQGIFMSDPRTTVGVDYAIESGLIAASRRDDILAGRIPNV